MKFLTVYICVLVASDAADSNTRDSIDVNFKISSEDFQLEKDTNTVDEEAKEKKSNSSEVPVHEGGSKEATETNDFHCTDKPLSSGNDGFYLSCFIEKIVKCFK